jgi:hypothetical protein
MVLSLPFIFDDGIFVDAVEQAAAAFVKWMDHTRALSNNDSDLPRIET